MWWLSQILRLSHGWSAPRKPALAAVLVTLLSAISSTAGAASSEERVPRTEPTAWRLATEQRHSAYWELGHAIERRLSRPPSADLGDQGRDLGLRIENVETSGSLSNVRRVAGGSVDFALAQQDVVRAYLLRNGIDSDASSFQVVGRITFDYLHILVRNPLLIEDLEDLRGMRIWIGPPESGTRVTARRFLDAVGISGGHYISLPRPAEPEAADTPTGMDQSSPRYTALGQMLRQRELDAAMLIGVPGFRETVHTLMQDGAVRLLPLDYRTLRLLTAEQTGSDFHRQAFVDDIPAGTYPLQESPVPTLVVPSLLLAHESVPQQVAMEMWDRMREQWREIRSSRSPGIHEPDRDKRKPLGEANLPLTSWAPARRASVGDDGGRLWIPIGVAVVLVAMVLLRRRLQRWFQRVRRHAGLATVGSIIALILLITLATYSFEHSINENFSSLAETLWSITLYVSSGLEDRKPYTDQGKVTAAMGLVLGPMLFATLTAWLAAAFIQWGKRMPKRLKDHYVVLNWNRRALEVIRQLHHPVITSDDEHGVIVVLTDDINVNLKQLQEHPEAEQGIFEDVFVSLGDPTDERSLRNANVQDSHTVIVLADQRLEDGADERTIRSVFMIRKIARETKARDLHVVAELVDMANTPILDEMRRDFPGMLEILPQGKTHTHLLAQAALNKGIIDFFDDLLSVSGKTNEIYAREIPSAAVGLDFPHYAAKVLEHTPDTPLIPVGIQRKIGDRWRMFCNPKPETDAYRLQSGDKLVVLAYSRPPEGELPTPERMATA